MKKVSGDEFDQAGKVWAEFSLARTARLDYDMLWYVLWEQYKGNPFVFYEPGSGRNSSEIYRVRSQTGRRAHRLRPLNNIGHAIDILTAKQMKARPVWSTAPTSPEPREVLAARAGRSLLRHFWDQQRLASRRRELYLNRNIVGNGFVTVQFNKLCGPFKDEPEMGECPTCNGLGMDTGAMLSMGDPALMGPMAAMPQPPPCPDCQGKGQVQTGSKRKALGDVDIVHVSPWEIYPDPAANCVEDAPHIFRAYRVRPDIAEARFPWTKDTGGIGPSKNLEEGESNFAQMARNNRVGRPDDMAWIIEKHMPPAPGEEHPRITILAGDRVVWPKPDDKEGLKDGFKRRREPLGRIPIYHFTARPVPETFFAQGYVQDMITSNDTVNRGRDLQHRHMTSFSQPKWLVEEGSVRAGALTTEVGEVVEYTGERPYSDRPAPLSEFNERLIERENNRVYEIAGVNELDRGIPPKNIEAAEALEILAEQGGVSHGPVILRDSEVWQDVGLAALMCAKANYDPAEQRFVQVSGTGSEPEAQALAVADLSNNVSVRVTVGSALHQNLALKRNHVLGLWDRQLITDPREALEEMEFGLGVPDYTTDRRLQEATAYQENEAIEKGGQHVILQGTHDHQTHIAVHRKAALMAQARGDMELAQKLTAAVGEHVQFVGQQPGQEAAAPAAAPAPMPDETPFDTQGGQGAYTEPQQPME